jgi:hypothetical protein
MPRTLEVSVVDDGLVTAIDIVNRFLQSRDGVIGPIQVVTPFELNVDRFSALGTSQTRVVLKPSERLKELLATAFAVNVNLGVVKEA